MFPAISLLISGLLYCIPDQDEINNFFPTFTLGITSQQIYCKKQSYEKENIIPLMHDIPVTWYARTGNVQTIGC
jgi:hypothetical protein